MEQYIWFTFLPSILESLDIFLDITDETYQLNLGLGAHEYTALHKVLQSYHLKREPSSTLIPSYHDPPHTIAIVHIVIANI